AHADHAPLVSTRFRANVIWLSKKDFILGRNYKLKIHTQSMPVQILSIDKIIDASKNPDDLRTSQPLNKSIKRHDIANLILETRQPIALDTIAEGEATGRFVIVDGYDIAGGGIITEAVKDEKEE